jgi:hypothetical protein
LAVIRDDASLNASPVLVRLVLALIALIGSVRAADGE